MMQLHGIKLVVFDLDGTLFDAYKAAWLSLDYALQKCGFPPVTEENVKRKIGWGERNLIGNFVPENRIDEVQKLYREYGANRFLDTVKILPLAEETLEWLKKHNYKIAVATNRPAWSVNIILTQLKIKHYFDYILCGDQVKNLKPDPEILEKIVKQFNLELREMVFVGDMDVDVQTARNAGVKILAVSTGSSLKETLVAAKPDALVDCIFDLIKFLQPKKNID